MTEPTTPTPTPSPPDGARADAVPEQPRPRTVPARPLVPLRLLDTDCGHCHRPAQAVVFDGKATPLVLHLLGRLLLSYCGPDADDLTPAQERHLVHLMFRKHPDDLHDREWLTLRAAATHRRWDR